MIQLDVEKLFLVNSFHVVLVGDTAEEDKELNELHLVRPSLIFDCVNDGAHRLSVYGTNHHLGNIEAHLSNIRLALWHHDISFLRMRKSFISSSKQGLILLQYLIRLHIVTVVAAEVITVCPRSMWIDELVEDTVNTIDSCLRKTEILVPLVSETHDHLEELVSLKILLR